MAQLQSLQDALIHELKDIYSAEKQLTKALPKMAKKAQNQQLSKAILTHLKETEVQIERLDKIATMLEVKLTGHTCKGMAGLIEEGSEILEEESENPAVIDALIIGAAQRVEHYEMAAYGTARAMAEILGETKIVQLLQQTLEEEGAADEKLSAISESEILGAAAEEEETDMDEENDEKSAKRGGQSRRASLAGLAVLAIASFGTVHLATAENTVSDPATGAMRDTTATAGASTAPRNTNSQAVNADQYRTGASTTRTGAEATRTSRNADSRNEALSGNQNEIMAKARRTITSNSQLSTNARNVKMSFEGDKLILRGPVQSREEQEWIEREVAKVAPNYNTVNEMNIVAK